MKLTKKFLTNFDHVISVFADCRKGPNFLPSVLLYEEARRREILGDGNEDARGDIFTLLGLLHEKGKRPVIFYDEAELL